jgi:hypothetical protein
LDLSRKQLILVVGCILLAGAMWLFGFAYLYAAAYGTRPPPGSWAAWYEITVGWLIVLGPVAFLGLVTAYWAWRHKSDFVTWPQLLFAFAVFWVFLLICAIGAGFGLFYLFANLH